MDATLQQAKPFVLVADEDINHGGVPLDESKEDCPLRIRDQVFEGQQVVPWLRLPEFQRESLRQIGNKLVKATPLMRKKGKDVQLQYAHEIRRKELAFPMPHELLADRPG